MTGFRDMSSLIQRLESRGGMYVQPYNFETVVAYLDGYDHAVLASGRKSYLEEFREWLHRRVGHHCSLHWAAVIRDVFAKKNKNVALRKLFEFFREFEKGDLDSRRLDAAADKKKRPQPASASSK